VEPLVAATVLAGLAWWCGAARRSGSWPRRSAISTSASQLAARCWCPSWA